MKKIWFNLNNSSEQSIKLRKLGAHIFHRVAPKTTTKLTLKLLCNPHSKRNYKFKHLTPTQSFSVSTRLGGIQTYLFGNPENPAVLLNHGWADTSRRMEGVIKQLLENGYCAYTFDQIGHGKSEGNISHLFGFVDSLESVIKHIEKKHPLKAIISHSMGGLATLNLPQEHFSNKRIALISPPVKFFEEMMRTIGKVGIPVL